MAKNTVEFIQYVDASTPEDKYGVDEIVHDLPGRWAICPNCNGNGQHDHPAFSNGITSSEWAEWDDDDREHYMNGRYDVQCQDCEGSGKVLEVDEDRVDLELLKVYHKHLEEMRIHRMECESERRMGA